VRHAFEINEGLRTQLKAAKENPLIYEVSITDHQGMVLVSTDEKSAGIVSAPKNASLTTGAAEFLAPGQGAGRFLQKFSNWIFHSATRTTRTVKYEWR